MQLLLAAYDTALSAPTLGGTQKAITISVACVLVLLIASRTIQKPHVGPKMPLGPLGPLFNDISLAGFIGSMAFGHILGTLAIMGFSQAL